MSPASRRRCFSRLTHDAATPNASATCWVPLPASQASSTLIRKSIEYAIRGSLEKIILDRPHHNAPRPRALRVGERCSKIHNSSLLISLLSQRLSTNLP